MMWNDMIDDVALVMDSSQQLNAKAKWDLHILLVEVSLPSTFDIKFHMCGPDPSNMNSVQGLLWE